MQLLGENGSKVHWTSLPYIHNFLWDCNYFQTKTEKDKEQMPMWKMIHEVELYDEDLKAATIKMPPKIRAIKENINNLLKLASNFWFYCLSLPGHWNHKHEPLCPAPNGKLSINTINKIQNVHLVSSISQKYIYLKIHL